jgi:predicted component of type VI protein secretion system
MTIWVQTLGAISRSAVQVLDFTALNWRSGRDSNPANCPALTTPDPLTRIPYGPVLPCRVRFIPAWVQKLGANYFAAPI